MFDNTSPASCCNCSDEPSTQGCGSSVVTTPEYRRTPETAGQSVAPRAPVKSSVHPTPCHMRSCETGTHESPVAIMETQVSPAGRDAYQMVPLSSHLLCPATNPTSGQAVSTLGENPVSGGV